MASPTTTMIDGGVGVKYNFHMLYIYKTYLFNYHKIPTWTVKSHFFYYSYLEMTLTRTVRDHDKATSFNYALLGSPENVHTVLEFVKNNIERIRAS